MSALTERQVVIPAARSVARGEPDDPWAYARRCAESFPQGCGQVTVSVQGGKVVQVDATAKKRFDQRN